MRSLAQSILVNRKIEEKKIDFFKLHAQFKYMFFSFFFQNVHFGRILKCNAVRILIIILKIIFFKNAFP